MTQKKRRTVTSLQRTVTKEGVAAYKRVTALEAEQDHLRDVLHRALKLRRGDRHPLDVSVHDHSAVVFLPHGHPPATESEREASARAQETRIALEKAAGIYNTDSWPHLSDLPADRERWRRQMQDCITPAVVKAFKRLIEIADEIDEAHAVLMLRSGRKPWETTGPDDPFYQALAEAAERS